MIDVGPLTRQAVKCVNEYIERADGNWKEARELWRKECEAARKNTAAFGFKPYARAVDAAFKEMEPQ